MAPKKDKAPPPSSKSGGGKQKERERPTFRMHDKTKMDPIARRANRHLRWLHATFPYRRTGRWPKGTKNLSEHEFLEYLDQKEKEAEENRNFQVLRKMPKKERMELLEEDIEEERKAARYMREQKHKIWAELREKMLSEDQISMKVGVKIKKLRKELQKEREARKLKILEKAKMFGYKEGDDDPEKGQGSKEGDNDPEKGQGSKEGDDA